MVLLNSPRALARGKGSGAGLAQKKTSEVSETSEAWSGCPSGHEGDSDLQELALVRVALARLQS